MTATWQSSKLPPTVQKVGQLAGRESSLPMRVHLIMRALRKRLSQIISRSLRPRKAPPTSPLRLEAVTWLISPTFRDSKPYTTPQWRDRSTQTQLRRARDAIYLTQRASKYQHSNLTSSTARIATKPPWLISAMSFRISPRKLWVAKLETACSPPRPGSRCACEFLTPEMKTYDEFCGARRSGPPSEFKLLNKVITLTLSVERPVAMVTHSRHNSPDLFLPDCTVIYQSSSFPTTLSIKI